MAFFTQDQIAILSATTVRISSLASFQWKDGTVTCVWNGNTLLVSGGKEWTPLHGTATIDGLAISGGSISESITMTLNGLPNQPVDFLRHALDETPIVVQELVIIFVQLFDDDWQPVGSPISVWWGFMQPPKINRAPGQDTAGAIQSIQLTAENAFFNRSRPAYGRYTDRDQQVRHPGDKFFQFIPQLINKTIVYPDY